MTREEARKILGEGASEEQVTNLINVFHNQSKDLQEKINTLENENTNYKTKVSSYESKLSESEKVKSELEAIKKSNMTEQEQIEAKMKEADRLLNEAKLTSNKAKVSNILAGKGFTDEQISLLVDSSEEKSINIANMLNNVLSSTQETTEKRVRGELAKVQPEPSLSNVNPNSVIDKEKFLDMSAEEQETFINEHSEEYNSLFN